MGHFNYKLCFHGPDGKSAVCSSGWSLTIYSMENSGTLSLAMFLLFADTQSKYFEMSLIGPSFIFSHLLPLCFVAAVRWVLTSSPGQHGTHRLAWKLPQRCWDYRNVTSRLASPSLKIDNAFPNTNTACLSMLNRTATSLGHGNFPSELGPRLTVGEG